MTVLQTLHAWAVAGSEIAAGRVLITNRRNAAGDPPPPRPAGTSAWISILVMTDDESGGRDWTTAVANPLAFADKTIVSVDAAANTLTLTAHGLVSGDGPVQLTGQASTVPGGLAVATDYWIIVASANAVKLAATFLDAINATPVPIDITSAGTGTHGIASTADTRRAGAEITVTTQGVRSGTLSLQCYGGTDPGGVLKRLKASTALPSQIARLSAGGVGVGSIDGVRDVTAPLQPGTQEPRAVMNVRFHAAALQLSETGGVIRTVDPTGTVT